MPGLRTWKHTFLEPCTAWRLLDLGRDDIASNTIPLVLVVASKRAKFAAASLLYAATLHASQPMIFSKHAKTAEDTPATRCTPFEAWDDAIPRHEQHGRSAFDLVSPPKGCMTNMGGEEWVHRGCPTCA